MHEKIECIHINEELMKCKFIIFDKQDKRHLKNIYLNWLNLNRSIIEIGGKRQPIPAELVEGIVCLECNIWKVANDFKVKYDLWDPNENENRRRIELKYTINGVYRLMFPRLRRKEFDRLIFVKLFIDNGNGLEYEIYEYDYEQVMDMVERSHKYDFFSNSDKVILDYKEIDISNKNLIKRGSLSEVDNIVTW